MKTNRLVCWTVGLVVVAGLACAAPPVSQSEVVQHLAGTWVGVSGHWGKENPPPETRTFMFMTNHQCRVTIDGKTFAGTYRLDVSTEPYKIDFTFEEGGKKITTLTIFDFPGEGLLRVAEWDPDWRRKEFAPGITFQKKASSNK